MGEYHEASISVSKKIKERVQTLEDENKKIDNARKEYELFNVVMSRVCLSKEKQENLFNEIFPECNKDKNVISESENKKSKNEEIIRFLNSMLEYMDKNMSL